MDLGSNSGSAISCVLTSEPVFSCLCDGISQAYAPGKLSGLNEIITLRFLMQHLTYVQQILFSLVLGDQLWVQGNRLNNLLLSPPPKELIFSQIPKLGSLIPKLTFVLDEGGSGGPWYVSSRRKVRKRLTQMRHLHPDMMPPLAWVCCSRPEGLSPMSKLLLF